MKRTIPMKAPSAVGSVQRRRSLVLALALTLGVVAWVAAQDDGSDGAGDAMVAAPRPAAARVATAASAAAARTDWPAPPAERASATPPPTTAAWGVAPLPPPPAAAPRPVQAVVVAPPPPQAPPFPYTWIGRVDDGTQPQALLEGATRTLSVKPRDVIDGQWRVEAVDAQGVRLTWLPTGQPVQVARPLS